MRSLSLENRIKVLYQETQGDSDRTANTALVYLVHLTETKTKRQTYPWIPNEERGVVTITRDTVRKESSSVSSTT